ncbi:hypothetical protein BOVMAS25_11180 [Streptococcus uberis]
MNIFIKIFTKVTTYIFLGYALVMIRWVGGFSTLVSLMSISLFLTLLVYGCTVIESFLKQRKDTNS